MLQAIIKCKASYVGDKFIEATLSGRRQVMKVNRARFSITALICVLIIGLMLTVVVGCQKEVKPTGTITLYTSVPTAIIEELKQ